MFDKKKLELKPLESESPDSVRIYDSTRLACERLNSYYLDFIETISILNENRQDFTNNGQEKKADEIDEYIEYVKRKLFDVSESMDKIADEMDFLVNIKTVD